MTEERNTNTLKENILNYFDELITKRNDPRFEWGYMLSKLQVDYLLLSKITITDKKILNVGCGYPIDELYFARVTKCWTAIDLSKNTVKFAKELITNELPKYLAEKIDIELGDGSKLKFQDESFDIILLFSTLDHILDKETRTKVLAESFRVLKKNGFMIITVPNKRAWFYNFQRKKSWKKTNVFEYNFTPRELRKMLEQTGFKIIRFASTLSDLPIIQPKILRRVNRLLCKYFREKRGYRMGYLCKKSSCDLEDQDK